MRTQSHQKHGIFHVQMITSQYIFLFEKQNQIFDRVIGFSTLLSLLIRNGGKKNVFQFVVVFLIIAPQSVS